MSLLDSDFISLVPDITSVTDVIKRLNLSDLNRQNYKFLYETSPWERKDFCNSDYYYDYNIFVSQIDRIYFCEVTEISQHEQKLRYLLCRTKQNVFMEFGIYVPKLPEQQQKITGSIFFTRNPFLFCKLINGLPMDRLYKSLKKEGYIQSPPNLQFLCFLFIRKTFYDKKKIQLLLPKILKEKMQYFDDALDATYEMERKSKYAILPFYSRSKGSFLLPVYI